MGTSMELAFTATKTPDGNIHVQDMVGIMKGQHHVHSPEGFERWRKATLKDRPEMNVEPKEGSCCDLKPGYVRECNDSTRFEPKLGEKQESADVPPEPEAPPAPKEVEDAAKTSAAKGNGDEMITYQATATVGGKKESKEFQHKKASPWAVKKYAATKFFAELVKDMKPLEVWKAINLKPVRAKAQKKAKASAKK